LAVTIISRSEARKQGLKRYFTGQPCCNGHICERFVSGDCVQCRYKRNSEWVKRNPEKKSAGHRKWCQVNAVSRKLYRQAYHRDWYVRNRTKKNAQNKAYLEKHPEVNRRSALRWRNKNIDKARTYTKEWYKGTSDKVRTLKAAKSNKRRALQVNAPGSHTAVDLRAILKSQNHLCVYCTADLHKTKKHVDHIVPLIKGGTNNPDNLQYTCDSCNLLKGSKDPIAFAQERGRAP
jgi:5-methylcytosine-specific restriction endonuclease McrA